MQTMTTTDTRDVAATVEQVKRCADAGADLVRITVQGKREAVACHAIREQLFKDRCAEDAAHPDKPGEPVLALECLMLGWPHRSWWQAGKPGWSVPAADWSSLWPEVMCLKLLGAWPDSLSQCPAILPAPEPTC